MSIECVALQEFYPGDFVRLDELHREVGYPDLVYEMTLDSQVFGPGHGISRRLIHKGETVLWGFEENTADIWTNGEIEFTVEDDK